MSSTVVADRDLTIDVEPDVANAIVMAVAWKMFEIGEDLSNSPVPDSPGDLMTVEGLCHTISRLSEINDQLKWCAHHGIHDHPKDPLPLSAPESTLLELAALLRESVRIFSDENEWPPKMATAARVLAAKVGAIEVTA